MPLSKTEAKTMNYLSDQDESVFPAEIAIAINVRRRTIYDTIKSLRDKGIVEEIKRGGMNFYKLKEGWKEIVKAAKKINNP